MLRAKRRSISSLDGVLVFVGRDIKRLLHLGTNDFFSMLIKSDHGVVVERKGLAVNLRLKNFRPFLNAIAEDDAVCFSKKLLNGQKLAIGDHVGVNRMIDAGTEHLLKVFARYPARRDIKSIGLGAKLGIKRECHFSNLHHIINGIVAIL